ncbi:DUF3551 domain-containing protein [Bradyrhizobium sp. CCBAU 11386]|uniref:DUF3551 domain-containing protein n=1 Tax=Bradyrhizobium sp. CCBAU 11386 TaxID=1630837 RepID=UPI002302CF73|nr:DUF3551 domain-containing protein [Bradyrhizobium sp. CCBAU 11386]
MVAALTPFFAPAAAEPLDPRYPVCLQKWEWGGSSRIYCSYLSWEDCRASAMGLSAMCLANLIGPRRIQPVRLALPAAGPLRPGENRNPLRNRAPQFRAV